MKTTVRERDLDIESRAREIKKKAIVRARYWFTNFDVFWYEFPSVSVAAVISYPTGTATSRTILKCLQSRYED